MKLKVAIILALLFATGTAAQGSDLAATVKDCNDCHGSDGVSMHSDVPTIAGISAFVHADYLFAYRDKARPCPESAYRCDEKRPPTDMCRVAQPLSDEAIEAVAAYYAARPFVAANQEFDPAKAAKGKTIHNAECEKCHSDGGSNADDDAGILAGQWMPYLKTAMAEFQSGKRPQPKAMKTKVGKLSDADIEALLHFYAATP